jgi:hypothetical protein
MTAALGSWESNTRAQGPAGHLQQEIVFKVLHSKEEGKQDQ